MILVVVSSLHRRGIALFPFILLKNQSDKDDYVLLNHERIHIRQQIELLVLPFYIFYLLNYLINLLSGDGHAKAYRNIVFEREAYSNEMVPDYLAGRKLWAFRSYFGSAGK